MACIKYVSFHSIRGHLQRTCARTRSIDTLASLDHTHQTRRVRVHALHRHPGFTLAGEVKEGKKVKGLKDKKGISGQIAAFTPGDISQVFVGKNKANNFLVDQKTQNSTSLSAQTADFTVTALMLILRQVRNTVVLKLPFNLTQINRHGRNRVVLLLH